MRQRGARMGSVMAARMVTVTRGHGQATGAGRARGRDVLFQHPVVGGVAYQAA